MLPYFRYRLGLPILVCQMLLAGCETAPVPTKADLPQQLVATAIDGAAFQTESGVEIGSLSVLLWQDGSIVVADRIARSLYLLGPDMRLMARAGREGSGPGEFQSLQSIHRCSDTTFVGWDPANSRLSVWTSRLDHLRSSSFINPVGRASEVAGVSSSCAEILLRSWDPRAPHGSGAVRQVNALVKVSLASNRIDTIAKFSGSTFELMKSSQKPQLGPVLFSPEPVVASKEDIVAFGSSDTAQVLLFDWSTGRKLARINWESQEATVPEDWVSVIEDSRREFRRLNPLQAQYVPSAASQSVSRTLPHFDRLMLGDSGTVWIREYRLRDPGLNQELDRRPETWSVLGPGGMILARVTLPVGAGALVVGNGIVLGAIKNSEGTETLTLFRLSGP